MKESLTKNENGIIEAVLQTLTVIYAAGSAFSDAGSDQHDIQNTWNDEIQ